MLVGYARVLTGQQNLDRKVAALKRAGCRQIFKEKQSGREGLRRLQLERAIEALGPADILVLAEWDRATRSILDGVRIIERVAARGAMLKALDRQWLDLTTPLGKEYWLFCRRSPRTSAPASWPAPTADGLRPGNAVLSSDPSPSLRRTRRRKRSGWSMHSA